MVEHIAQTLDLWFEINWSVCRQRTRDRGAIKAFFISQTVV